MNSVMLALSTFRQSENAIVLAVRKAAEAKNLIVVFIVDINIERYMVGSDIGLYPKLKEKCEQEILCVHKKQAEEKVKSIMETANKNGIITRSHIVIGRFGIECVNIISKEKPEIVITTRSGRPKWIKKIFGSPVDYIIANAGCRVLEA